ncbi:MAG: pilus assembly protein N-terminal domain-containing protein [Christensenellaceae bacterium]|jgi:hypothetical protein|nr:pilus assembly protein N-terminal domain-containing protein [Christensenellaceae bacterium]
MNKRRLLILIVAAVGLASIIGLIAIFSSNTPNPYSKASMSVSRTQVEIDLKLKNENGILVHDGIDYQDVRITIDKMPKNVDTGWTASVSDKNVATVNMIDNQNMRITAGIKGGKTDITVVSNAGGLAQTIEVSVNIIAKDFEQKDERYFAVQKLGSGEEVSNGHGELLLDSAYFNFYSVDNFKTESYTPTDKKLDFEILTGDSGCQIEGNKFIVGASAPSVVNLRARLSSDPTKFVNFKVYVIEPYGNPSIPNQITLVKNAETDGGDLRDHENIDLTGFVGNRLAYSVSASDSRDTLGNINVNSSKVRVEDLKEKKVSIISNDIGACFVEFRFTPKIETENGTITLNSADGFYSYLTKTHVMEVVVLNMFKDGVLRANELDEAANMAVIKEQNNIGYYSDDDDDAQGLNVFYVPQDSSDPLPRTIFSLETKDGYILQNTQARPHNANILFELYDGSTLMDISRSLKIEILENGVWTMINPSKNTKLGGGFFYNNTFAISLNSQDSGDILNKYLTLVIKNVPSGSSNTSVCKFKIPLEAYRFVSDDALTITPTGNVIDLLNDPTRAVSMGISVDSDDIDFINSTDEEKRDRKLYEKGVKIVWDANSEDKFTADYISGDTTQTLAYDIKVNQKLTQGVDYGFTLVYFNRISRHMRVRVWEELDSITPQVVARAGGEVLKTETDIIGGKPELTVFVKKGGNYEIVVQKTPSNGAGIWVENIIITKSGVETRVEGAIITATATGTITYSVSAVNDAVFGNLSHEGLKINLVVLDILTNVSPSLNNIELYTLASLGTMGKSNASKELTLGLKFASGGIAEDSYLSITPIYPSQNFELEQKIGANNYAPAASGTALTNITSYKLTGLLRSETKQKLQFNITQTFENIYGDEDFVYNFTNFYDVYVDVDVKDAVQIEGLGIKKITSAYDGGRLLGPEVSMANDCIEISVDYGYETTPFTLELDYNIYPSAALNKSITAVVSEAPHEGSTYNSSKSKTLYVMEGSKNVLYWSGNGGYGSVGQANGANIILTIYAEDNVFEDDEFGELHFVEMQIPIYIYTQWSPKGSAPGLMGEEDPGSDAPVRSALTLKDSFPTLNKTYNNANGFNHIMKLGASDIAVFYSGGEQQGSAVRANRYYFDDIFKEDIDANLSAYHSYEIQPNWILADLSSRALARIKSDSSRGEVSWYFEVNGTGNFEIEFRNSSAGGTIIKTLKVAVIPSIEYIDIFAAGIGRVGYKSLMANDPYNFGGKTPFSVRRGQEFSVNATLSSEGWSIRATIDDIGGTLYNSGDEYDNRALNAIASSLPVGDYKFTYIPYYDANGNGVWDEFIDHYLIGLKTEVIARIQSGATELTLDQSESVFDSSAAAIITGSVISDITTRTYENLKLTDILKFDLNSSQLNTIKNLFVNSNTTNWDSAENFIRSARPNDVYHDDNVSYVKITNGYALAFALTLEKSEDVPGGDFIYEKHWFKISINVLINPDFYNSLSYREIINNGGLATAVSQFAGNITATEIRPNALNNAPSTNNPLRAQTPFSLFTSRVDTVDAGVFADVETFEDNSLRLQSGAETQNPSILYNGEGLKGLMRITAVPYASPIDGVSVSADVYEQFVGYEKDSRGNDIKNKPIYEYWTIYFTQMIYDEVAKQYIPLSLGESNNSGLGGVASETRGPTFTAKQVSTVNGQTFGWNGCFYFAMELLPSPFHHTQNFVPTMRPQQNSTFNLSIKLNCFDGEEKYTLDATHKIYLAEKPGLSVNYCGKWMSDGQIGYQALGTETELYVSLTNAQMAGNPTVSVDGVSETIEDLILLEAQSTADRQGYILKINSIDESLLNKEIRITFAYTLNDDFAQATQHKYLVIKPVLFTVSGYSLTDISSNTIYLMNNNKQQVWLEPNFISAKNGIIGASNTADYKAFEKTLNAVMQKFTNSLNSGELVRWFGAYTGEQFLLNNGSFDYSDTDSRLYGVSSEYNLSYRMGVSNGRKYIISVMASSSGNTLRAELGLSYENSNVPYIVAEGGARSSINFNIITRTTSDEDNPIILTSDNFAGYLSDMNIADNKHYILMSNITLTNYVPFAFNDASIDGNNYKIYIQSFNIAQMNARGEYNIGLFSSVGENSVVKNVQVVIPNQQDATKQGLLVVDLYNFGNKSATVNFGAIAGVNNGIITNCAVLSERQFPNGQITANYDQSAYIFNGAASSAGAKIDLRVSNAGISLNAGGLVGQNGTTGAISNSRVLIDISVSNYATGATTKTLNEVILAGFVAINNGYITTSFFRDGNINNDAETSFNFTGGQSSIVHYTAGFVGRNNAGAVISASYIQGESSQRNSETLKLLYGSIRTRTGYTSGFAYENRGTINDCLAEIKIVVEGANRASGFLYKGSAVNNCIANVAFEATVAEGYGDFYGLDNNMPSEAGTNNSITPTTISTIGAARLLEDDTIDITKFESYSISNDDDYGVWRMTEFGPRLISANYITVSMREESGTFTQQGLPILNYVVGYSLGSKINPILITSGEQFNRLIYIGSGAQEDDKNRRDGGAASVPSYDNAVFTGHMRLVRNIKLNELTPAASATGGFVGLNTLQTYKTTLKDSTLDGNGFTISEFSLSPSVPQGGIFNYNNYYSVDGGSLENAESDAELGLYSFGLFSKLDNAVVKNLTIKTITTGSAMYIQSTYAGVLAGMSIGSSIVDVNIEAGNLRGAHIVGGLVGEVTLTGDERIENISVKMQSTVDRAVGFKFTDAASYLNLDLINEYADENTDERNALTVKNTWNISGGVFGTVFVSREVLNNSEIDELNNIKNITLKAGNNISAEVAGGFAGVLGEKIVISKINSGALTFTAGAITPFFTGGIVGINFGEVNSSTQDGDVIITLNNGNLIKTIEGDPHGIILGGIVGYNYGVVDGNIVINGAIGTTDALIVGGVVSFNNGGDVSNNAFGQSGNNDSKPTVSSGLYRGGIIGYSIGKTFVGAVKDWNGVSTAFGDNTYSGNFSSSEGLNEAFTYSESPFLVDTTPVKSEYQQKFIGYYSAA